MVVENTHEPMISKDQILSEQKKMDLRYRTSSGIPCTLRAALCDVMVGAQAAQISRMNAFWMTARCIIGTRPGDIILSSAGAVRKRGEKAGADCRERKLFSERGKAFRRSFRRTGVGKEGGTWSSIPFRG